MTENGNAFGSALYELGTEDGICPQLLAQSQEVCHIMQSNPQYMVLLSSRALSVKERVDSVKAVFAQSVHPYLLNVLSIFAEKASPKEIFACANEFRKKYNDEHNIVDITATAAVAFSSEQQELLLKKLEAMLQKNVILKTKINPAVLGGVKLEMPGVQLDGTVKNKLESIRAMLSKE